MVYIALVVLGLVLGSFVNALVWRIHAQEGKGQRVKGKGSGRDLSILHGRSMCPHCKHRLGLLDLIPVFSWLALRGRCRYCHKPIGWQYPSVELITAVLFAMSYLFWPHALDVNGLLHFSAWLIMLTGFVALAVYDFRWMILPNRIIYPLIVLAGLAAAYESLRTGPEVLLPVLGSVAVAGGIFYALFQLSRARWIGGGDVKLGFLIGLILRDPWQSFLVVFLASAIGTLVILPGMITKKVTAKSRIPFGPFLIVGAIIAYLFGEALINWYKTQLLLVA